MTTQLTRINWHPFAANPLDYIGNENLRTPGGDTVRIERFTSFRIYIAGALKLDTNSNSAACAFLYENEVGLGR